MNIAYTVLFSNYEELKEPLVPIPDNWKLICFTDQNIKSDNWQIVKKELHGSAIRTARYYKILFHKIINTKYSLYLDASFQINTDLNAWWDKRFKPPFTCVKHPLRNCIYKEAHDCLTFNRGNREEIKEQIKRYKKEIPERAGLIQSGILMRERSNEVIDFCEQWYAELMRSSTRDQLSFTYAAHKNPVHNLTNWNYRTVDEFIFKNHYHKRKAIV